MFYHPKSALEPALAGRPAIEGINIVFGRDVASIVAGGCGRERKRVGYWRNRFMALPDLLCWPLLAWPDYPPTPPPADATRFVTDEFSFLVPPADAAFHPDLIADHLNQIARETEEEGDAKVDYDGDPAIVGEGIPDDIQRAIAGKVTDEDRAALERPRVILHTPLTCESRQYDMARAAGPRRDGRRRD